MEKDKTTFIHVNEDGRVTIKGGIVFHPFDYSIYNEANIPPIGHSFSGSVIYRYVPKWYQIGQWFKIMKYIYKYMNNNSRL